MNAEAGAEVAEAGPAGEAEAEAEAEGGLAEAGPGAAVEEGPAEWEELWAPVGAAVGVVAEVGAGQPFGLSTQASPAPGVSEGPAGCLRPRTDSAGGMN